MGFLSEIEKNENPKTKIEMEKVSFGGVSPTIPLTHPQPCPVCRCPSFWVSIYDPAQAHCRACKPFPANSVVKHMIAATVRPGDSQEFGWKRQEQIRGLTKFVEIGAAADGNPVADDLVEVVTADGVAVLAAQGWDNVNSKFFNNWLRLAVKYGTIEADALTAEATNRAWMAST